MKKQTVDALKWIVDILNIHHVQYQLTGGFAAKLYGSSRELHDIDIDIPNASMQKILPDVAEFITYGPAHFRDAKWDMELMTLDYNGQEIDVGGINTLRISNKERTEWISYPNDLSNCLAMRVDGIDVKVQHPLVLASYKKELDGDHQLLDIEAAEKYAAEHDL